MMKADEILQKAIDTMRERAKERARDSTEGERSMGRAVQAFNALTGASLTERQGWLFMVVLKAARGANCANVDDWLDMAAYAALAGETVEGLPKKLRLDTHTLLSNIGRKYPELKCEYHHPSETLNILYKDGARLGVKIKEGMLWDDICRLIDRELV